MLGFVSKFGSVKGMVTVPDLSGQSPSSATNILLGLGLNIGSGLSSSTSNSGSNNQIYLQSIASGTLVDLGTSIDYSYYYYVPPYQPTVTYGSCTSYSSYSTGQYCNGTYTVYSQTGYYNRRAVYYDGVFAYWDYSCADTPPVSPNPAGDYIVGSCGYTAPVATCTATTQRFNSGCIGGYSTTVIEKCGTNCLCTYDTTVNCCSSTTTSYGSWSGCVCKQRTRDVITTTTCGSSSTTTTTTQTASCTGGPC